jgi:cell division protein FtsI/penicillin-binding protein 2
MSEDRRPAPIPSPRLLATYAFLAGLLLLFIGRLYQLQIVEGPSFVLAADDNRFDTVSIPAPRGDLRPNGYQLVRNIPIYNVVVTPRSSPTARRKSRPSSNGCLR